LKKKKRALARASLSEFRFVSSQTTAQTVQVPGDRRARGRRRRPALAVARRKEARCDFGAILEVNYLKIYVRRATTSLYYLLKIALRAVTFLLS
jgi:hypothetical protein